MSWRYLTDNRSWTVKRRAFRIWQLAPHRVAPMNEVQHTCQSCGTAFQGNYCPRCGQSARIGRFSFKTAFKLFLDVWGMGNRGMFHSIRDLILRPGYMIRDYLSGCQSAYFPPFKMFFILSTISLLISNGISFDTEEHQTPSEVTTETKGVMVNGKEVNDNVVQFFKKIPKYMKLAEEKAPTLLAFLMLLISSVPLYLFFRRCPKLPDLRFSEHVVALVYTSNMYSIYRILADLTPICSTLIKFLSVFMVFVALKQFTGYSKRRLFWYMFLAFLIISVLLAAFIALIVYIVVSRENAA